MSPGHLERNKDPSYKLQPMASWWGILGLSGLLPSFTILLGISFAGPKWEAMGKEPGRSTKSSLLPT